MSFQPPQPPGPPSQGPPAWGGPPIAGTPAGGVPQVPVTPTPGRAHKPRMIAPAMIIAALVLIAVAVGVVVLAGGGGGGVDAEGAAEGFAALADDAEYDESGTSELRRCPFGDQDELSGRVADVLDLPDDVVDGETLQYMSDRYEDFPESLWCLASAGELREGAANETIIYSASDVPREDYDRFLEDSFPNGDVEVGDAEEHEGGTIYPYCFASDDEAYGLPGCGADWVDEDHGVTIGLNYTTDDDDPDAAVEALKELLPDLVKALAAKA